MPRKQPRALVPALLVGALAARAAAAAPVDFVREVKPILDRACVSCHGPAKRKGELRLDTRAAALAGGLSGPSVVPGKAKESPLLQRVLGEGGEDRMPLKADPLTAAEVSLLRRWIDEGAIWPEAGVAVSAAAPVHWAYAKPVRPSAPKVARAGWVRNPIDAFVLARLEREGLAPSPEAPPETLLRRLSLDLVGLPPTPEEVDAFVRDRRPDAWARAVERLLASPHHGERWARPWLDLARYADSHGYEKDRPRVAWKWRDWVIDALNRNLSFKQFTVEQLAGDMLPNATVAQQIAC
jgi:mono/diheme cytochrome c family protein